MILDRIFAPYLEAGPPQGPEPLALSKVPSTPRTVEEREDLSTGFDWTCPCAWVKGDHCEAAGIPWQEVKACPMAHI